MGSWRMWSVPAETVWISSVDEIGEALACLDGKGFRSPAAAGGAGGVGICADATSDI